MLICFRNSGGHTGYQQYWIPETREALRGLIGLPYSSHDTVRTPLHKIDFDLRVEGKCCGV